jgi:stalled ribosome alternative rescue factor ArfA|tara:strand:- start:373 stop:537 length:165 start_codon:yes stop_codon:yes gene_type:complete
MKITQKKIAYRKKKNNPIAIMLKDPQFRQQKVANKKIYNRKEDNAGLLRMLGAI